MVSIFFWGGGGSIQNNLKIGLFDMGFFKGLIVGPGTFLGFWNSDWSRKNENSLARENIGLSVMIHKVDTKRDLTRSSPDPLPASPTICTAFFGGVDSGFQSLTIVHPRWRMHCKLFRGPRV